MTDQNSGTATGTRTDGTRVGVVRRLACGTVAAAGILGALTVSTGPAVHAAAPEAVDVAMVRPLGPPPPPPGCPPAALHQPGQEAGPDAPSTCRPDSPPPSIPPGNEPICQDIMDVPVNQPCHDPSLTA